MAVEWGSVSGHLRVGLNVYASGTEMVASVYISTDDYGSGGYTWNGNDSIKVSINGPGGNDDSWNVSPVLSAAWEQAYVGQVRFEASPDTSYSFTASASGLHTGGSPSFTRAERSHDVPNKPSTPTASSITDHDATINWSMPSGNGVSPTSINIQLDNNSNFSSPMADYYDGDPPSLPFAIGGNGSEYTVYYVRIRGHVAGFGSGPWSNTLSFRLLAGYPSAPRSPSVNVTGSTNARFSWSDPSDWGNNDYGDFKCQIDSNSSFSSPQTNTVYNENHLDYTNASLNPYTLYYVRVRAFNSRGNGSWSSTVSFRTDANPPNAPGSLSTTNVSATGAKANWGNPSNWGGNNTDDYKLYLSTNSNMSGATSYTVYNTNNRTFSGLASGQTYYWRVRGFNAGGDGSYSSTQSFTTLAAPVTAPRSLHVDDPGPIGAVLDWTEPTDWGAENSGDYQVAWRLVGTSWTYVDVNNASSYAIPQTLQPNSTYEWTVRAVNSYGNGPYAQSGNYPTWNTSAPPLFIKKNGSWRSVVGTFVKKNGTWRPVTRLWVKKNGTWR